MPFRVPWAILLLVAPLVGQTPLEMDRRLAPGETHVHRLKVAAEQYMECSLNGQGMLYTVRVEGSSGVELEMERTGGNAIPVVWALMKDHPTFREIMTALAEAAASSQPVWYITRSGCLLDVIQLSPKEDALLGVSPGR